MVVDLSKVSKAIQTFVKDVQKMEGDKKSIDTQTEFKKLSDYLAGNKDKMNTHEKEFIEGFMFEYTTNQAAKTEEAKLRELEDNATDSTKDLVKKVAKMYGNRKKIDNDAEAQTLAQLVNNPKSELSKGDIDYIKNVLIRSGYERYLELDTDHKAEPTPPKEEKQPEATTPPAPKEAGEKDDVGSENAEKTSPRTNHESKSRKAPRSNGKPRTAPKADPPKLKEAPKAPVDPKNPPKLKEAPKAPADPKKPPKADNKPTPNRKYEIPEAGRNSGNSYANIIINEINSNFASNTKIHDALMKVDSQNAFTFVGRISTQTKGGVNEGVFSVSDVFNKITYKDTLHVMKALLQQAKDAGLEGTPQYNKMKDEIAYVTRKVSANPNVDPDEGDQIKSDMAIADLYYAMADKMANEIN